MVIQYSGSDRADAILDNQFYQTVATSLAGTQEYMAMEKLGQLLSQDKWDLVVVDTPPSRNALDFLDAPGRMLGFLEGRALQVFLAPGGLTARLFGRGTALVFAIFARVTGVDMLGELSRFFRSLTGVIDGFGERTRGVSALLRSPDTSFLIVTSPEVEPAREARFLADRLRAAGMPLGELVVNRVHTYGMHGVGERELVNLLAPELGERLAERVVSNLADFDVLASRDRETIAELSAALGGQRPVVVAQLDEDVQDLRGLTRVAQQLFG
jgi:anion-transporting  ArsA/GET3 family ATPase